MKPILFGKNATTFTTNGIGRLEAISCVVVEEMNGQYELTMVIAETAAHASEIEMSSIIVVKPSHGASKQPFRVYKITKPINGKFTVCAQHISYQLSYIPTMPFTVAASASACNNTLQALKTNAAETCPFTFWTDVTTVSSYKQTAPASIRSRLGGVEGSVLDQFGGEYEWDGYTVKLWKNRGLTVPNVSLRYGKNITDLTQEQYISNTITGVCPYWISSDGNQTVTLPEKVIESQYADQYPFRRTIPLDLSAEFDDAPTQTQVRTAAQAYVNQSGIGVPTVSIKVSFVDLSETEEYKDVYALQAVNLCDQIRVEFEKLGISTTAKVVKTSYDVLKEKYASIEVGSVRTSLAQTISNTNGAIETAMLKATHAVQNATQWLTSSNGYVIAVKNTDGTWKELIFADSNDPTTWHNLLRINENGIGFSHDGGTTYNQAWTLDGKMVIGGTAAPALTVYGANNTKLFEIDNAGMMWSATNSSMTKAGTLTAKDATLTGGSMTILNGQNVEIFKINPSGELIVKDASDHQIFKVSSNGVVWNTQNSSMTANGTLSANGATLTNATITGGTLTQENDGRRLELKFGNIHGGFINGSDNIVYLAYRVSGNECIALQASGVCFDSNHIYVRDGIGGTVYEGYDGDALVGYGTDTIVDYWGESHTVISSVDTRQIVHGIIID